MAVGGGETQKDPSGWTVDTLHAHYDQRLRDLELRLEQRFQAQEAALAEKDATTQARLANINEFRAQLGDVLAQSLPRSEAEQRFRAVENSVDQRLTQVNAKNTELAQRHTADVSAINSRLDLSAGAGAGIQRAWGIVVAAVLVASSVVGAIVVFTR